MALFEPATGPCPPRQFCPGCDEELIHRDHRKPWESSSGFGQIFWRDFGRGRFGAQDLDLVVECRRGPSGLPLILLFEHKEAAAEIKFSQSTILQRLAVVIHASIVAHALDQHSGVYTVRGRIGGRFSGRRETYFDGSQIIQRVLPMPADRAVESWPATGQDALFRWIDARLGFTPDDRCWRGDS